jgi:Rrf2 family protein
MLISKTSRYALQAATFLAERWGDADAAQAAEIAEGTGVPKNYLSKVLHQLARQGVLVSERGPKGGFRLARDPAEITLAAVIEPVEPSLSEQHCLLGRPICSDRDPCLAHSGWKALSDELRRFLDETTLAELVRR